tara:strand:+ start:427 stop:540 length:114 start_codon:yes stop_codon:yes gene_type:complete
MKIDEKYPDASKRERTAIRNIVLRCRKLKIVHVIDES